MWSANAPEQLDTLVRKNNMLDEETERDYQIFRDKFNELIMKNDQSRANTLIYNTIYMCRQAGKSTLQTVLILIDALAVELNK